MLIKYSGKYVKIYFNMKITFFARHFSHYFTFYLPFDLFPWFQEKSQSFAKKKKKKKNKFSSIT